MSDALDALKDVHTEHCCAIHGCKYYESDTCPVVTGAKPQSYPCEVCGWVREQVDEWLSEATDEELLDEVDRRGLVTVLPLRPQEIS